MPSLFVVTIKKIKFYTFNIKGESEHQKKKNIVKIALEKKKHVQTKVKRNF